MHTITLPNAESLSSTLSTLTELGNEFLKCYSSKSEVICGTISPYELPTHIRPTSLESPNEASMTGMNLLSS